MAQDEYKTHDESEPKISGLYILQKSALPGLC